MKEDKTDEYGNPIDGDEIIYCCFPDCGCDGSRLCMAKNGASDASCRANVEGMYQRRDLAAQKAKLELVKLCIEIDRHDNPKPNPAMTDEKERK